MGMLAGRALLSQATANEAAVSLFPASRRACEKKSGDMPAFYLLDEGHTLAAALRPALEAACPDEFAAVTQPHPLDRHLEVTAPAEAAVRHALLAVRAQVAATAAAIRS